MFVLRRIPPMLLDRLRHAARVEGKGTEAAVIEAITAYVETVEADTAHSIALASHQECYEQA